MYCRRCIECCITYSCFYLLLISIYYSLKIITNSQFIIYVFKSKIGNNRYYHYRTNSVLLNSFHHLKIMLSVQLKSSFKTVNTWFIHCSSRSSIGLTNTAGSTTSCNVFLHNTCHTCTLILFVFVNLRIFFT